MKKFEQRKIGFVEPGVIVSDIRKVNGVAVSFEELPGVAEFREATGGLSNLPEYELHESDMNMSNMSTSWQLDLISQVDSTYDEDTKEISLVTVFKFGSYLRENPYARDTIEGILRNGYVVIHSDGSYTQYERYLRSSSGLRAGGGFMCKKGFRTTLRNAFSLGVIDKELKAEQSKSFVSSKWEAVLSLSISNSHAIKTIKPFSIRVVPDFQRKASVAVSGIAEYTDAELRDLDAQGKTPISLGEGLDKVKYELLSEKADKEGNPDVAYELSNSTKNMELESVDGCCIGRKSVFTVLHSELELTEEEKEFATTVQFRAPYMKGLISEFDIDGYCDEFGITTLVDIYGEQFDPRDVDIIMPESCFKGHKLFRNMTEFYQALYTPIRVGDELVELFPQNEWFRVAGVNKEKEQMRELTYQYLQAILELDINDLVDLGRPFAKVVREGVTKDVAVAKKFLGMVHDSETDKYAVSMVSKAQEMIELCPAMLYNPMVQNTLKKSVKTKFWNMTKGRVPIYGGYHYIIGDLAVLFVNTFERVEEKGNDTILTEDDRVLLKSGENFLDGFEGESVMFRSPLIHPSEVRKSHFQQRTIIKKYFSHLKGVVVFNSYDATAISMGGADYDGDRIYKTENETLLSKAVGDKPIIVSPLETYKPSKMPTIAENESAEGLFDLDCRTIDNKTGEYTNMGTFYIGEYYDVERKYNQAIDRVNNAKTEQEVLSVLYEFFPGSNNISNTKELLWSLETVRDSKLEEINYKLTVVRIAQAGEIDFPKHGVRFCMPKKVVTRRVTKWLDPERFDATNFNREMEGLAPYPIQDTPLQRLFDAVSVEWVQIEKELSQRTYDTTHLLVSSNIDQSEFNRIYPMVQEVKRNYSEDMKKLRSEVTRLEGLGMADEEEVNGMFGAFFDKYIDIVGEITTDRKTLASVCCHLCFATQGSNDAHSSFPFIVAYDGVLMNLAESAKTAPRIIAVPDLDVHGREFNGSIIVEEDRAYHNATGIEVDIEEDLPVGEYNIFSVKGIHYVKVSYRISNEDKETILRNYYDRDSVGTDGKIKAITLSKRVPYDFTVTGLRYRDIDSDKALLLLDQYKSITFKEEDGALLVYTGDTNIGVVYRKDKSKYTHDMLVKLSDFIGHKFSVVSASPSGAGSVQLRVELETNVPVKSYELDEVHSICDMSMPYWNVQWKKFSEFQDFEYNGIQFILTEVAKGNVFAKLSLNVSGRPHSVYVKYESDNPYDISIASIHDVENKTIVPLTRTEFDEYGQHYEVSNIDSHLVATILRATAYCQASLELSLVKSMEESIEEEFINSTHFDNFRSIVSESLKASTPTSLTEERESLESCLSDEISKELESFGILATVQADKYIEMESRERLSDIA